jgi:hypothetical protein
MYLKLYLLLSLGACTLCANAYVVARFDLGASGSPVASGWQPVAVGVNSDTLTSISGTQNGTTVTVFANPDQDPIPLSGATTGTLDVNEVTTDANGNATVQFNLGTLKDATFLRAETAP